MNLMSLLYVSEATDLLAENDVHAIVQIAQSRNPALGVTGALVFTGHHFAQLLEGPREGVEEIMASIHRDARHRDLDVIEAVDTAKRRFADWSLAYAGPSLFVDQHLRPLVEEKSGWRGGSVTSRRLIDLMVQFASAGREAGVRSRAVRAP